MARKVIGPTGSRRRRWLFLCTTFAAIALAVIIIPSALAVHDNGVFQLDGNASTALQSTPPAAEDWDLICKANQVTAGTLAATWGARARGGATGGDAAGREGGAAPAGGESGHPSHTATAGKAAGAAAPTAAAAPANPEKAPKRKTPFQKAANEDI